MSVKGLTVIGLPLLALLLSSLLTLSLLHQRREADLLLEQAQQVESELQRLHTVALDAGAGVRGYLLTGNEELLSIFTEAEATLPSVLEQLDLLLAEHPAQLQRLEATAGQLEQQFHGLRTLLDYSHILGGEAPEALRGFVVASQVVMDGVTTRIREMQRAQRALVAQRVAAQRQLSDRFLSLVIISLVTGGIGGVFGILLFSLGITNRAQRLGENARRLAQGLPLTRHPAGLDELGRLDDAMHNASALLAAREAQLRRANRQVRARLDELAQRNEQISLLNRLGAALHGCQRLDDALSLLRETARALMPDASGALFLRQAGELTRVLHWGLEPLALDGMATATAWGAAASGGAVPGRTPTLPRLLRFEMNAQGRNLGVLLIGSDAGISRGIQQLLAAVTDRVSLAIANLRLRASLEEQAVRDPLTGLYNRRYLESVLEQELQHAERTGRPLAVVVADIDHFKQFNDSYGHEAGDEVLRAFGRLLREGFRKRDVPCRYGGEEFLVVLPETDIDDARRRAEQFAREVRTLSVKLPGGSLEMISVSVGVAVYPHHSGTADELIRRADEAMYRAKGEGRNRVVLAG